VPTEEARAPKHRGRKVGKVLLWVLPIVLVFGIAVAAVGWYARRSYYVGVHQGTVTIFKGVPGGLAGWDPTIQQVTDITVDDLRPADQTLVSDKKHFSSLTDAQAFLGRIEGRNTTTTTTGPPTSTSTTTTVLGATTTTTPVAPAPAPTTLVAG